MNKEAQRIAIAEACGWQFYDGWHHPTDATKSHLFESELPDYLADLNACHEMEKVLSTLGPSSDSVRSGEPDQWELYIWHLYNMLIEERESPPCVISPRFVFDITRATAAQRAEAFLRAIGKWQGGEGGAGE